MGDFNRSVIFDAIRRAPNGRSRVELVEITGLSTQTVSNIARWLLDQDLIVEAGKAHSGVGKPRTLLRLNPTGMYAAGVHVDPAVMTYVVLDLAGGVVAHARRETPEANEPEQVMRLIREGIERLIDESGVARDQLVGLGVAVPGPIDHDHGTIVDPPHLIGWHHVQLRDSLEQAIGLPVLVDKDVTAAAVAETWAGGANGTGSFVFLYLGTGVGAGLVLGDELMRGVSGNAGEVGHIVTDPAGPECWCGQRGCVAVTCTPQAIVEEAERTGVIAETRHADVLLRDPRDVDAQLTRLCAAADDGDGAARAVLERAAARTSRAVAVLTNLLDVDRVVFGGPAWQRLSAVYLSAVPPMLGALSATGALRQVPVVGTGVGEDVGAVGAACLVLEHTFMPSSARLLLH
ncbi:ROK family protein [Agromyces bauzanensis]